MTMQHPINRRWILTTALAAMLAGACAVSAPAQTTSTAPGPDLENILVMDLPAGRVVIEMRPDLAPRHVARIKELVRKKYYDGSPFHRVIQGFMAQTGDPTGTGLNGTGVLLPLEASNERHVRGTVSMARGAARNSADNQFFICYDDIPALNGRYTIWGRVLSGMEHVEALRKGPEAENGRVQNPDRLLRLRVAADLAPGERPALPR